MGPTSGLSMSPPMRSGRGGSIATRRGERSTADLRIVPDGVPGAPDTSCRTCDRGPAATRFVRRAAAVTAAAGVATLAALAPGLPPFAHGAPTQPISRTAACASGGEDTGAAACRAARQANGQQFGTFDNLRVPDVNGADKTTIPDGKLCSGGLPEFRGLDLPRTDWPATTLTAGGTFHVVYRATIPHEGRFRIYLTRPGYDPAKTLGWDDLSPNPILTVNSPPLSNGAYRMSGRLPADRTGRHVLYIVWQTTSTPDTYYSCSDLTIKPAATPRKPAVAPVRTAPAARKPSPAATRTSAPAPTRSTPGAAVPAADTSALSPVSADANWKTELGREIPAGALLVIAGVAAGAAVRRIRRRRTGR